MERRYWNRIVTILSAIVSFLSVLHLFDQANLLFVILAILSIGLLFWWRSRMTLIFFFVGAVTGLTLEAIAVNFGAWSYAYPSALGVPAWLALLWGLSAACIAEAVVDAQSRSKRHSEREREQRT